MRSRQGFGIASPIGRYEKTLLALAVEEVDVGRARWVYCAYESTGATAGDRQISFGDNGNWIELIRGMLIKTSGFNKLRLRNLTGGNVVIYYGDDPNFEILNSHGDFTL